MNSHLACLWNIAQRPQKDDETCAFLHLSGQFDDVFPHSFHTVQDFFYDRGLPIRSPPPCCPDHEDESASEPQSVNIWDPGSLRTRRKTPFPWAVPILVDTFPWFFAEAMNTPQNRRLDPKNGIIWGLSYGARNSNNSNNRGMLMWLIGIIHIYQ